MMAKEKVDITADADVARAIEKLVAIAREYGKIGDAAAESGEKGAKGAKSFAASMDGVVGKWFTLGKGIELATSAIKAFLAEQAKLREEQVGATRTIDTGLRGYQSAAGNLSDAAAQDAAGRILAVAQQSKASVPAAFGAATLLAGFHVPREQAEGAALAELLQFQDVAKLGGATDPQELSRHVLDALQRANRPITGDTIRKFGAATLGLSRKLKGFDAGEIGVTGEVATYGRNAGLGLEETAAIVGVLSEQYGESGARRQFKSLFKDSDFTSEERQRIAGLRAQAAGLMSGSERDYATAAGIYSGSMAAEEELAGTQYDVSGYRPGIQAAETVKNRFLTASRQAYGPGGGEWLDSFIFDVVNRFKGPDWAAYIASGEFMGGKQAPAVEDIYEKAIGRKPLRVQLVLPDGRDIPSTTSQDAADGLGGVSNDPTQYENFRP